MKKEDKIPYDKNGEFHGYWEKYDRNGNLSYRGYYFHGKMYGYWEQYWSNGKPSIKTHYINGEFHGSYEFYRLRGSEMIICYYHMGLEVYRTSNSKLIL